MEDKEWVLKTIEALQQENTRDVDEVCMALEHSTIFATEMIQNLTKTILDLQQENQQYKNAWNELKEGIEINMDYYDSSKFKEFVSLNDIEELEQKYNLDKEE